jgi:hypothetical protein
MGTKINIESPKTPKPLADIRLSLTLINFLLLFDVCVLSIVSSFFRISIRSSSVDGRLVVLPTIIHGHSHNPDVSVVGKNKHLTNR